MGLSDMLRSTLQAVMEQRTADATDIAIAHHSSQGSAALSLATFAMAIDADFDRAVATSFQARATARQEGPREVAFAAAATAFCVAARGESALEFSCDELLSTVPDIKVEDAYSAFIRYLAVEGALGSARLDLIPALIPEVSPYSFWSDHDFGAIMVICRARAAAFAGQIDEARFLITGYQGRMTALPGAIVAATLALIAGNAGDEASLKCQVEETTQLINEDSIQPTGYLGRGLHLLLAYGLVALGDRLGAAQVLLRAGVDAGLSHLILVDRALGLDVLVAAALEREDLVAAYAWLAQARELSGLRAAAPAVARAETRVALAEKDVAAAVEHARRAVALAVAEARVVEAYEAELLLSSALIVSGDVAGASQLLQTAVATSDTTGHKAVRQSASRTLRTGGRRLKPVRNGGWEALSPREREVAELLIAGAETADVARALVLSPATVRVHISRVLAAFGVVSRIGLVAAHTERPDVARDLPELTPRQGEVVALLAMGRTNAEIGETLGMGPSTVENHVGEIRRRLKADSRFAVARIWWAGQS